MTRREFAAALAAASLLPSRAQASAIPFQVHFARPNPYDQSLRFLEPGSDEYLGEKTARLLELRLERIFAGQEPAPAALQHWVSQRERILAARFYALPDAIVRYEIQLTGPEYHTGLWKLPDFQTVAEETVKAAQPYFRDVTAHTFGTTPSYQQQLIAGNVYWRARLDSATGIDVYGNQGIAVGDIDNDGSDEVYVCQPGGLPNRLYKIGTDGTAVDLTERAGVGILDDTTSALFADFRNSGLQDLVVLRGSGPLFFVNQGNGTFREQPKAFQFASMPQGSFTGMAAADYDRNGRLDLYLCCYVYFQSEDQYQFPAPYHDARNGPPNFLFRNRSTADGMVFEDVTTLSGMNHNNDRFSFAPAWCDADGDGYPDLYVANDFGRNNFYRNRQGHFHDEAATAGIEDMGPGMSASWFDYDGDGRPDLYVSNMWTAPGQRVVRDPAFQPAKNNAEAYRRHTKGNSLYRNRGDGTFEENTREGVEMGRWAWGSGGFDWDLDGAPEIFVATGMMTNPANSDVESFFWRQVIAKSPPTAVTAPDYENAWSAINQAIRQDYSWAGHAPNVFYQRRDGKYRDASGVSGLDFADDTRSFAVADFDGDGYLDLILKSRRGPQVRAMQNNCANGRPVIAVRLSGVASNRDGVGARVAVNGQVQFVQAGSGFLSQHSKQLHFGLREQPRAQVEIQWPSGAADNYADLEPGFAYSFTEGERRFTRRAFRKRVEYSDPQIHGVNEPQPADVWLMEPVPTPDKRKGPGFVMLYADQRPIMPAGFPVDAVDLSREKDEVAATFALFRRYLFEYRAGLSLPLVLLIDADGRACKVYAQIPSAMMMRDDLAHIGAHAARSLPFPGKYYAQPRRNYFKLGAAFYWAGYPQRALPYIEETLRREPANWRALHAAARIQQEIGQYKTALVSYEQLLRLRPNYAPALVGAGEAYVSLHEPASAQRFFKTALASDPGCADAMNQMGLLSAESSDFARARKWFEQAIATQRDHSGAINNLGVLFARVGQRDDSIAAFLYGIRVAPEDETLYLNLGRVYVTMGEHDRARGVLRQLLDRKPGDPVGVRALAELEGR